MTLDNLVRLDCFGGFIGHLGTYKLVRLGDELTEQLNQLNIRLAGWEKLFLMIDIAEEDRKLWSKTGNRPATGHWVQT